MLTPYVSNFINENPFFVIVYGLVVNGIACLMFGIDKKRARKRKRRIPESVLLTLAIIGGSIGSMTGMYMFNHKTNHTAFLVVVPLSFVLYTAIIFLGVLGAI